MKTQQEALNGTSRRFDDLTRIFDRAASKAFSAVTFQDFLAENPEISEPLLFMAYGVYLQVTRQACANAQAEFRVLAEEKALESKLMRLEAIEMQQGLDGFGGLAQGTFRQQALVPQDVARSYRLASKRSEHRLLVNRLEEAERQLADKRSMMEQLTVQAEKAATRYHLVESSYRLDMVS